MLLYKHDEDLRQEMFAIEFIKTCDVLLKASGLDLKILTFQCVPVGAQRGFIEWSAYALSRVPWHIVLPLVIIAILVLGFFWAMQWWEIRKNRDPLEALPVGLYQPSQHMPSEYMPSEN